MQQNKIRKVIELKESKYAKVKKLLDYMNMVCYGKKKSN